VAFEAFRPQNSSNDIKTVIIKYNSFYIGINNVRGGSYVAVQLPEYQLDALQHELKTSNDKCFKCGKIGHYAIDCYATPYNNGTIKTAQMRVNYRSKNYKNNDSYDDSDDDFYDDSDDDSDDSDNKCYRCGRIGHYASSCYANTKKQNSKSYNPKANTYYVKTNTCYKCGREGHYATECYAKQHVKGYKLNNKYY